MGHLMAKSSFVAEVNCKFSWSVFFLSFCLFQQQIEYIQAEENTLFEPHTKMEHKFANIQTAFGFLSMLVLRDHSKWRFGDHNSILQHCHLINILGGL